VKVENGAPDAAFSLIEWTIPPGAPAPPRHVHRRGSETFYILEGELEFPLDDTIVRGTPGACLHVPPGTAHTLSNRGDRPARALELFVPGELMGLVEEVGKVFAAGLAPNVERIAAVFAAHDSELVPET
jgi:mannose-6-phosphate isomerase-like protein (cupin superfamily)